MFNYKKILFGLLTVFTMNQSFAKITLFNKTGEDISILLFDEYSAGENITVNNNSSFVVFDKDLGKTLSISFGESSFCFNLLCNLSDITKLHNNVTYNIYREEEDSECSRQIASGYKPPCARSLLSDFDAAAGDDVEQTQEMEDSVENFDPIEFAKEIRELDLSFDSSFLDDEEVPSLSDLEEREEDRVIAYVSRYLVCKLIGSDTHELLQKKLL